MVFSVNNVLHCPSECSVHGNSHASHIKKTFFTFPSPAGLLPQPATVIKLTLVGKFCMWNPGHVAESGPAQSSERQALYSVADALERWADSFCSCAQ